MPDSARDLYSLTITDLLSLFAGLTMPNWEQMFVPDLSIVETFLRASAVYLALLILFRLVLKRQTGSIGLPDVLLVVLVSECVSASLSAEAKSIPNGLVAALALLLWNYVLDWVAFRWPWLERRLQPRPLPLIRDGHVLRENMESEDLTDEELLAQLRMNGIEDVSKVKIAFIESEGTISVIPEEEEQAGSKPDAEKSDTETHATDFDGAMKRFLASAENLRAAMAWHEERATDHREAARSVREVLARHGVAMTKQRSPAPAKRAKKS